MAALTASWVHSWLEFSCPSVRTTTVTLAGRSCSGVAANSAPTSVISLPSASYSAVAPPRLQLQRRNVTDRTVCIDDLVIGVEPSQRDPDVQWLFPLLGDEGIEA